MRYLILTLFLANMTHTADWPNWRGPKHDGISR
ncbi:uncharacterized protein METZ01_LOCUS467549, partial [marine metagenome]